MIFARKSDAALASLVKQLDALVEKHADKKLSAFVNFVGDDRDALEAEAKQFAADHKIANLPIVVPIEFTNGPENFGIHPDAEVTVTGETTTYVWNKRVIAFHRCPNCGCVSHWQTLGKDFGRMGVNARLLNGLDWKAIEVRVLPGPA